MKEEILALIRELAELLEPGATAVWEIMVRQQVISGRIGTICSGVLLLIALIMIAKAIWDAYSPSVWAYILAALFICAAVLPWFVTSLQRLMNPAYYAIMAIKSML
jgi:hypothetical protein